MIKNALTKQQLLIFLFELSWGIKFNIVGSISLAELFLFIFFIYGIANYKRIFKIPEFKNITFFYFILLVAQIVSEIMVKNSFSNASKGIAITIVSFCHLYFLTIQFMRRRYLLVGLLAGIICKNIFFPEDLVSEFSSEDLADEHSFSIYMKFYVAPILTHLLLIISICYKPKYMHLILIIAGIIIIVFGARSAGVILLFAGLLSLIIGKRRIPSTKTLSFYAILFLMLSYGLYAVYVRNVINGNIKAGNSEQILRLENPYNPINLLSIGRTEVLVGAIAFSDSPLWGWGSWKSDADLGYKYSSLQSQLNDSKFNIDNTPAIVIPSHSVIVGYGTNNGIFAFLSILALWIYVLWMCIKDFKHNDNYSCILYTFLILFIWNSWFSPTSHLRQTLPLYMAFIFVQFYIYNHKHTERRYRIHGKHNRIIRKREDINKLPIIDIKHSN